MFDNISILDQVHEIQILVNKLRDLSIHIPESFQVGAIIAKLPPSWNNFRKKLLHMSEDLTLEQFRHHLQIEEECWARDGTNIDPNVNVSNVQSGSSSKTDKHLKVNKSGNGFKKTTPRIPTRIRRTELVSIVERNVITFANVNS